MGGMGGAGGAGGMNPFLGGANPADLMKQFGAGQGGPNQMQDMMQQFKAVSNIFQTPEMQDFLKNPEKMEDIRKSLKDNPFMKQFIEKDENIMKVRTWEIQSWRAHPIAQRRFDLRPQSMESISVPTSDLDIVSTALSV